MRRTAKIALSSAASVLLVLSACSSEGDGTSGVGFEDCDDNPLECNSGERIDGGDLVWALDSGWNGWTNAKAETFSLSQLTVIEPVSPGHIDVLPDGSDDLDTATWDAEPELINEDPMQVRYQLNPDANWGDGTSIGYDDFIWFWYAYSGDPTKCEACTPPSTVYGANVESIEEEKENSFVITFREGYTNPEWRYTNVILHPAHIAEANGFTDWQTNPEVMAASVDYFAETPPLEWSAGPYRMIRAEVGDYAIYEPNQDWAGDTDRTLDTLTFQAFNDTDAIFTEMRQEAVHGTAPRRFDPNIIDQLRGAEEMRHNVAPGAAWEHITLNTQGEFLSDVELRRAVFTAIDVKRLNERVYGNATDELDQKLNHLFGPDDQYFVDHISQTTQGTGDIEAARQILDTAGYTWDEDDNLLSAEGDHVRLDYRVIADNVAAQTKAELVQFDLENIGIDMNIDPFNSADLTSMLGEGEFDLAQFGWTANPLFAAVPNQQWHSASASNFGKLHNDDLDATIDRIQQTLDMDEAAAYANEAVAILTEEAYVLPLIHNPALIIVSEDLVNVRDNWATPTRATYNVAEWGFVAQ
ncbi:ABC transporter substrate-binding protein [Natronoglycomyces albus]|uniref:Solute-binding protein family 5 domain-containing protein n=1 Tax=Natronoglycomyces albus TaxID=2811108 RepID=A0A895XE28_9ACTN|nr:ABC transporter substrate-binding protein [Natronoglycomyces albus]QSB04071.1 hypothetical protein JQS30_09595 [Natronoglycomyces albus]